MPLESLENAYEELKRADHLLFVSLKYTRTVDIFKHIIERLIGCCGFTFDSLLLHAKEQKTIEEVPLAPVKKAELLRKMYKDDPKVIEMIDIYLLFRKVDRAEFSRAREYRRHVTMTVTVDGQIVEMNIDKMHDYFEKMKEFYTYTRSIVVEKEK